MLFARNKEYENFCLENSEDIRLLKKIIKKEPKKAYELSENKLFKRIHDDGFDPYSFSIDHDKPIHFIPTSISSKIFNFFDNICIETPNREIILRGEKGIGIMSNIITFLILSRQDEDHKFFYLKKLQAASSLHMLIEAIRLNFVLELNKDEKLLRTILHCEDYKRLLIIFKELMLRTFLDSKKYLMIVINLKSLNSTNLDEFFCSEFFCLLKSYSKTIVYINEPVEFVRLSVHKIESDLSLEEISPFIRILIRKELKFNPKCKDFITNEAKYYFEQANSLDIFDFSSPTLAQKNADNDDYDNLTNLANIFFFITSGNFKDIELLYTLGFKTKEFLKKKILDYKDKINEIVLATEMNRKNFYSFFEPTEKQNHIFSCNYFTWKEHIHSNKWTLKFRIPTFYFSLKQFLEEDLVRGKLIATVNLFERNSFVKGYFLEKIIEDGLTKNMVKFEVNVHQRKSTRLIKKSIQLNSRYFEVIDGKDLKTKNFSLFKQNNTFVSPLMPTFPLFDFFYISKETNLFAIQIKKGNNITKFLKDTELFLKYLNEHRINTRKDNQNQFQTEVSPIASRKLGWHLKLYFAELIQMFKIKLKILLVCKDPNRIQTSSLWQYIDRNKSIEFWSMKVEDLLRSLNASESEISKIL